jgi:hypothetical protein
LYEIGPTLTSVFTTNAHDDRYTQVSTGGGPTVWEVMTYIWAGLAGMSMTNSIDANAWVAVEDYNLGELVCTDTPAQLHTAAHCTLLHTAHCTLHTAPCTLYTAHCTCTITCNERVKSDTRVLARGAHKYTSLHQPIPRVVGAHAVAGGVVCLPVVHLKRLFCVAQNPYDRVVIQ